MIGSLFEELKPLAIDETDVSELPEDLSFRSDSEDSLLAALPVVQKIVGRKTASSWQSEASDLLQGITLRLLKWRRKYQDKSEEMSSDEWQSFAAKTAYNEISRHYSNNPTFTEIPLDSTSDIASQDLLEGESDAEIYSLVVNIWQEICSLSLRQRQALVLNSQELVIYFLKCGIDDDKLAGMLNFTADEWVSVKTKLPLSDRQIADLKKVTDGNKSIESTAKSIKKARYEARFKIRRLIAK